MASAINIIVNVDTLVAHLTRVYAAGASAADDPASGWMSFEDISLYGRDPAAFRRLAEMCHEAATAIEVKVADEQERAIKGGA